MPYPSPTLGSAARRCGSHATGPFARHSNAPPARRPGASTWAEAVAGVGAAVAQRPFQFDQGRGRGQDLHDRRQVGELLQDQERLLTLRVWHAMWLARIDNKIADILVLSVVDDVSCS